MKKWIPVDKKLPRDGQHVLVWDDRDNVFPWRENDPMSDDGTGRVRMGDAIFRDKKVYWDSCSISHRMEWENDWKIYLSCNGPRYTWEGQGPCSFNEVTHWMPLPKKP